MHDKYAAEKYARQKKRLPPKPKRPTKQFILGFKRAAELLRESDENETLAHGGTPTDYAFWLEESLRTHIPREKP
jgi:hypothetical protein